MHLSIEEAELVPSNECQVTSIPETIQEEPIEAIEPMECQMTAEEVNSLQILVDFDNVEKSIEVGLRAGNSFISLTQAAQHHS